MTNPVTRHPVVTANAAATLTTIAPNRVALGVGTGDSGVRNLRARVARFQDLQDFVTTLRELLETGAAVSKGKDLRITTRPVGRVPILMSAHSERALGTAARCADGIIVGLGISPEVIRRCLQIIEREANAVGKSPGGLEIWWVAPWYVSEDGEAARAAARWHMVVLAHHLAQTRGRGKLIPPDKVEAIVELGEAYALDTHGRAGEEAREEYARLCNSLGLSEYLIDRFALAGTPAEVRERLRLARAVGAHKFDGAIDAEPGRLMERPTEFAHAVLHG